jgi:hypothetical protein
MIIQISYWLIAIFCLYAAYRILTFPDVSRKGIIRNYIQLLVDSDKLMTSSDKIVLMKKQLDNLDVNEIPQWQKDAFVKAVLEKLGNK